MSMQDDSVKEAAAAAALEASKRHGQKSGNQYVISSLRYWDVHVSPTKRHMVAGRFVPSVRGAALPFFSKKRRITIELYTPAPSDLPVNADLHNETRTHQLFAELLHGITSSSPMQVVAIGDNDLVAFRILKPKRETDHASGKDHADHDTQSVGSMSVSTLGFGAADMDLSQNNIIWKERYRCLLHALEIVSHKAKSCDLKLGTDSSMILKTISFDNTRELQSFMDVVNEMNRLRNERAKRLANSYKEKKLSSSSHPQVTPGSLTLQPSSDSSDAIKSPSSTLSPPETPRDNKNLSHVIVEGNTLEVPLTIDLNNNDKVASQPIPTNAADVEAPMDDRVQVLVEIVAASNLPVADILSSDPYIKVFDGSKEIHRTDVLSKTLNPVWTVSTKSLFIIDTTLGEYFSGSNFITFEVKDYDAFKKNNTMGTVEVSKETLLKGTGERVEFDIYPPGKGKLKRKKSHGSSTLALRFRGASPHDVTFMESLAKNQARNIIGIHASETFVPQRRHRAPVMKQLSRKGKDQQKEYRIKPWPDPERKSSTTWMTKSDMDEETVKPSKSWIEAGTGNLGKIYVEILSCRGLPNLDFSVSGRDRSDPFSCLVFEDCVVNTDVINDCLSPRWLPWTQRAFIFNIRHPSSQLMVGVFDDDLTSSHDFVGRAVVNLTNLCPGTLYTTTYMLYNSQSEHRTNRGTVTLRLRIDLSDARKTLLAGAIPTMHHDVSVAKREHFRVVHHTVTHGEHPSVLSLSSMAAYVQELQSYLGVAFYAEPAIATIFLWRGHFPVSFRVPIPDFAKRSESVGCLDRWTRVVTFKLPVHSMISFSWGISLARNLDLLPSFLIFCVGWFLMFSMEMARNHPSAMYQPKSYVELLQVLIFNQSGRTLSIKSNEHLDEINTYNDEKAEMKRARDEVLKVLEIERKKYEAYIAAQTSDLEEEIDVTTKSRGDVTTIALAPFRDLLLPLQQLLHGICVALRVVCSIITWRDSYISFWIVTASFAASFCLLWIPWAFLLSWTFKILVWVLLGPWMKLLDIFYFRRMASEEEQMKKDLAQKFHERYTTLVSESLFRKLRNESALKLKDMKMYLFGQYLVRVPVLKEEKFVDDPLPTSFAEPFDSSKWGDIKIIDRKFGQLLEGDMIPLWQKMTDEAMPDNYHEIARNGDSVPDLGNNETEPLLQPKLESGYGSIKQPLAYMRKKLTGRAKDHVALVAKLHHPTDY